MKYITAILFMLFMANTVFAQIYKNVWEVPDAIQMGYKGKVKKVTKTTYNIKMNNGNAMQDTIEENIIDSFDVNGFLQYRKNLKNNETTIYNYVNNKLDHSILYTNGIKTTFNAYTYENPRIIKYTEYDYDKAGIEYSLTDRVKIIILNRTNKIDTFSGCSASPQHCLKVACVYVNERTKKEYLDYMGSGDFLLMDIQKTLLTDKNSNPVEVIIDQMIINATSKANYTYEYYDN